MNTRRFMLSLVLSLLGTGLWAQQNDLPQVFSPNAAELGKYGKIPVSYFNGLPNISLPLTELKAKNYTLPIYLTYHASGNKPDQHPGWVGLGWTLHAGGCINRIVNGMKDEMTVLEYQELNDMGDGIFEGADRNPGYYFNAESVQATDWTDTTVIRNSVGELIRDRDPDEFQVCLEDIQASFYIYGANDIRIVSRTDADFTVNLHMTQGGDENSIVVYPSPLPGIDPLTARRHYYFDTITITSKDGTKYRFGGDDTSVEYSMPLTPTLRERPGVVPHLQNTNEWRCSATASTWYLTKIERPDGEVISFIYEKDGTPIVRQDIHHGYTYDATGDNTFYKHFDTRTEPTLLRNISYTLLQPSYLKAIRCGLSTDSLAFSRARTTELAYPITESEFQAAAGVYDKETYVGTLYTYDQIMSENYYMQLTGISGPERNIRFLYSADTVRRLTLNEVGFLSGNTAEYKYSMEYNATALPGYQAKQTDLWGYYNGIYYGNTQKENLEAVRRQVDPTKAQAEILTAIHYPTGGRTEFYYEGHTYAKEMKQFPMRLVERNATLSAGGIRIREIRDIDSEGKAEKRYFDYSAGGFSSGILAGTPRLFIGPGNQSLHYYFTGLPWVINGGSISTDVEAVFSLYSENPVRPLSTTDGNHITYSRVTESRGDGSATVFEYINHDSRAGQDTEAVHFQLCDSLFMDVPFNSHELSRGLVLKRTDFATDGRIVRTEENTYATDSTHFMNAVSENFTCGGLVGYYSFRKIYTGFPYLKRKVEKEYPDTGNSVNHTMTTDYTYDTRRRLTEEKRWVKGTMQRDKYRYIDACYGEPYYTMKTRNMIAYPVEHLHYRKDTTKAEKVVGAELTTWKALENNRFVPKEKYVAALGEGVSSFTSYNGSARDSHYGEAEVVYERHDTVGNLLLARDRSGIPTTYYWDARKVKPTFIARDAMNGAQTRSVPGNVTRTEVDSCSLVRVFVKNFTSAAAGSFSLTFKPSEAVSDVVVTMDGDTLAVSEMQNLDTAVSSYTYWMHGQLNPLPAGEHEIRIQCAPMPIPESGLVQSPTPKSPPVLATRFSGSLTISYSGRGLSEQTYTANDLFFEDFESDTNGPAGFHSGKAHSGSYTVSVPSLDLYRNHVLDYRRKTGSGVWEYVRVPFTGSATIGGSGVTVDQIRVFPEDADVESYTWDSAGNLLSRTDVRGITESYEYDALGRLIAVRDNEGNYVEKYEYNYQNK